MADSSLICFFLLRDDLLLPLSHAVKMPSIAFQFFLASLYVALSFSWYEIYLIAVTFKRKEPKVGSEVLFSLFSSLVGWKAYTTHTVVFVI